MCFENFIHIDVSIINNNDIQSCDTKIKKTNSIPSNSTLNHHAQCIVTTYASMLNLHTNTRLPPVGKEYMCFQNDDKTADAARCIKSMILTKVIDSVFLIDTFEQHIVVIKYMFQSRHLKDHVHSVGIDQSLSNNDLYEHKCLENSINNTRMLVSVTTRKN